MTCRFNSTETDNYFEIDLMGSTAYTWDDIEDTRDTDISFVSCNTPWFAGENRGYYFDGEKHSIAMQDLYIQFEEHQLFFIFKIDEWDFTLFHAHLQSNENYNPDDLYYEIWVDRCGYLHYTLGDLQVDTTTQINKDEWIRLRVSTAVNNVNTSITVEIYNEGTALSESPSLSFTTTIPETRFRHYETNGSLETHIGSFKGLTLFMEGHLAYFAYALNQDSADNISGTSGAYDIDGTALSDCAFGEWDNSTA